MKQRRALGCVVAVLAILLVIGLAVSRSRNMAREDLSQRVAPKVLKDLNQQVFAKPQVVTWSKPIDEMTDSSNPYLPFRSPLSSKTYIISGETKSGHRVTLRVGYKPFDHPQYADVQIDVPGDAQDREKRNIPLTAELLRQHGMSESFIQQVLKKRTPDDQPYEIHSEFGGLYLDATTALGGCDLDIRLMMPL